MSKNQEIERCFLVKSSDINKVIEGIDGTENISAFLDPIGGAYRRFRQDGNKYIYTEKSAADPNNPIVRKEIQREVSKVEFEKSLINAVEIYKKKRYKIPLKDNLIAELDVYYGAHDGVITVEVEFEDVVSAKSFLLPDWFGKEITGKNVIEILKSAEKSNLKK